MSRAAAAIALLGWMFSLSAVLPQTSPPQVPGFRSSVDVVQLDVGVVAHGQPVTGLSAADFEVKDDGKKTDIIAFEEVKFSKLDATSHTTTGGTVPESPQTPTAVVFVVDDINMPYNPGVAKIARQVVETAIDEMAPSDVAAVKYAYLGSDQAFTTDRIALKKAVSFISPHPGAIGCHGCSVRALEQVAEMARPFLGRKVLIYVGSGVGLLHPSNHGVDLSWEIRDALLALQQAHVVIYGFDPRGLETGLDTPNGLSRPPIRYPPLMNEGLLELAEATGGRARWGDNEPWRVAPDVFAEARSYYLIGFQASKTGGARRFHRLDVRVHRPDVEVHTRSGYLSPDKQGG